MRRHAGFTLIEIIAVLGIAVTIMGIGVGVMMTLGQKDKLVVAEQLVADAVRQARHTARSTGGPVIVTLDKGSRLLYGASRTPIKTETFDRPNGGAPLGGAWNLNGRTGNGLRLGVDVPAPVQLSAKEQLYRGGKSDGFYIALDVRPPPATSVAVGDLAPLVLIADDTAHINNSQVLLYLKCVKRRIQGTPQPVDYLCWDLRGAIVDSSGNPTVISTIDAQAGGGSDVADPIMGETWFEAGFLYDKKQLVLYRDSRTVAKTAAPPELRSDKQDNLFLGKLVTPGNVSLGSDVTWTGAGTVVDNVRLYRLGTSVIGRLPPGIEITQDYQIVAHPDGQVEVNPSGGSANPDIVLKGQFKGAETARVGITTTGMVTSKIETGVP
ncbi:hypothetical protein LBMAG53_11850 [Planctomycetota bacterium]|nr:hypothetical protein LBMAG53_11850 [Planctomycetota bacterium]